MLLKTGMDIGFYQMSFGYLMRILHLKNYSVNHMSLINYTVF